MFKTRALTEHCDCNTQKKKTRVLDLEARDLHCATRAVKVDVDAVQSCSVYATPLLGSSQLYVSIFHKTTCLEITPSPGDYPLEKI